jgi:hypothetical protein
MMLFWVILWSMLCATAVSLLAGKLEITNSAGVTGILFALDNCLMGMIVFFLRRGQSRPAYIHTGTFIQMGVLAGVLLMLEYRVVRRQQLKGLGTSLAGRMRLPKKMVFV